MDDLIAGLGVRFTGRGGASRTGEALAAPGDVNGDGFADFLIAARGASQAKGEVYPIHGRAELPTDVEVADIVDLGLGVIFRGVRGCARHGGGGAAIAAADFLDGKLDFIIGAPAALYGGIPDVGKGLHRGGALSRGRPPLAGRDRGRDASGRARHGRGLARERTPCRAAPGRRAAAAGDLNGDGLQDLLVAEPSRFNFAQAGKVHLIYGRGSIRRALVLERVEPGTAPTDGGTELT